MGCWTSNVRSTQVFEIYLVLEFYFLSFVEQLFVGIIFAMTGCRRLCGPESYTCSGLPRIVGSKAR